MDIAEYLFFTKRNGKSLQHIQSHWHTFWSKVLLNRRNLNDPVLRKFSSYTTTGCLQKSALRYDPEGVMDVLQLVKRSQFSAHLH